MRRLCLHCRQPYRATEQQLIELGLDMSRVDETLAELRRVAATTVMGRSSEPPPAGDEEQELDLEDLEETSIRSAPTIGEQRNPHFAHLEADGDMPIFYKPVGCDECGQTGYRGRMGIFELMMIDQPVRKAILANSDSKTIQRIARERGMRSLREDGARQVIAGVTSVEDVLAATQATEMEAAE